MTKSQTNFNKTYKMRKLILLTLLFIILSVIIKWSNAY